MNDYEITAQDCQDAENAVQTAWGNAQDEDIQTLLTEATEKVQEAKALAEERV